MRVCLERLLDRRMTQIIAYSNDIRSIRYHVAGETVPKIVNSDRVHPGSLDSAVKSAPYVRDRQGSLPSEDKRCLLGASR